MGQQQLLFIILGIVIVGIAVVVGITMFMDNAASSNRDAMSADMLHLAAKARHYYGRPTSMGGGGHSFLGVTMDKLVTTGFADNSNGRYYIEGTPTDGEVVFRGVGKVAISPADSVVVQVTVTPKGPDPIILISGGG